MEILSNLSISLNTTDKNGGFGNSMMSANSFSYALEAAGNQTMQKQYLDMVEKQQKWAFAAATENPFVISAMNNKKEVTLIEAKDEMDGKRSIDHIDRKYIIPLALKASIRIPTTIMTTTTTTTTTSTRKPPILPDSSPNIDDLKRHILMLQNLTRNDENFQSKFVVFPSLQRPSTDTSFILTTGTISTTSSTTTPYPTTEKQQSTTLRTTIGITKNITTMTTKKRPVLLNAPKPIWPSSKEELQKAEKITIVSFFFLLFAFYSILFDIRFLNMD